MLYVFHNKHVLIWLMWTCSALQYRQSMAVTWELQAIHDSRVTIQVMHDSKVTIQAMHDSKMTIQEMHDSKVTIQVMHDSKVTMQVMHDSMVTIQVMHDSKVTIQVMHNSKVTIQVMLLMFYKVVNNLVTDYLSQLLPSANRNIAKYNLRNNDEINYPLCA